MITEIGITAGDIWHQLDRIDRLTFDELIQKTGKSRELLLMGLGWLAREGHVILEGDGTSGSITFIKLNKRR